MGDYRTIEAGSTDPRVMPLVKRADGSPITTGTVNLYIKALSGTNSGKWWRDSDQTWQVAETANVMTHQADGSWSRALAASPWDSGALFLEYAKESGDLHVPVSRNLKADYTPSANSSRAVLLQNGTASGQILAFGGAVQVGAYSAGQDPGSLVLQNPATRIFADGDGYVSIPTGSSVNVATISGNPADCIDGTLIVSVQGYLDGDGALQMFVAPAVAGDAMTLTAGERTTIALAVWNTLRSVTFAVGSIGEKIKLWLLQLGTDNRVLVSANTHTSGETVAGVTGGVGGDGFTDDDRATLADIDSRLVGTTITLTSPVTDAGEFTIHKTFDYKHIDSQSIDLSVTGAPDLTGAALVLEESDGTDIQAGSVVTAGSSGTQTIRFEFTRTATAALTAGRHNARIRATLANGDQVYLMALTMLVRP